MPMPNTTTEKTILKIAAVLFAAFAGTLPTGGVAFTVASFVGVALQALTVSGLTKDDWIKTGMKLASQIATTLGTSLIAHPAGAAVLSIPPAQLGGALLAVGAALTAFTVPAPGTAATLAAATGVSTIPGKPRT